MGFTFPTIHEGSEVSGFKSHPNSLTALSEALEDVEFLGGRYPFIGLLEGVITPFISIGSGPILYVVFFQFFFIGLRIVFQLGLRSS